MSTIHHITTAEQLLATADLGRCELICGELVMMSPAGYRHGRIVSRVNGRLDRFVEQQGLGDVTGAETGFQIRRNPDTVRAPDVGFVCTERVPATVPDGFFPGTPDLAVEVLSPSDRMADVLSKVQDWISAGCRAVWLIDPANRTITVYDDQNQATLLTDGDELTGGDLLPGFRWSIAEIFR